MMSITDEDAPVDRERGSWALLRLWHFEVLESELEAATVQVFTRTSYVSAPERWRRLPVRELTARLEQLLGAHHRVRSFSMRDASDVPPVVPFGYDFAWVAAEASEDEGESEVAPWMFPRAKVNPRLVELARREAARQRRAVRGASGGSAAGWTGDAFAVFRVDEDDRWQLLRRYQHASLFAARHGERGGEDGNRSAGSAEMAPTVNRRAAVVVV